MIFPFNTFTVHNLIGFMVTGSLAVMFYVVYWRAGRRKMDLIAANFIFCAGGTCLVSFLTDNIVPAGMSSWGWAGGPTAEAIKYSTLEIHRFAWVFGILAIPTQLHFILYYCQKHNFLRRHIRVLYVAAAALVPTVWTPLWVSAPDAPLAETSSWGSSIPWLPNMGPAAFGLVVCTICLQTYGLVQLWKTKRLSTLEFAEAIGGRRIVFAALMVQMGAVLGDMYTGVVNAPMVALTPIGAGVMGLLLSVSLIRARVESDRARHQLQAEKAATLECVPQPLFYFDDSARLQWANKAAAAFAGRQDNGLVGTSLNDIIRTSRKDRPAVENAWRTGEQVAGEIVREDDSTWIVNASPVLGAAGKPTGAVVLATDITEIRRAQEALRNSNIKILEAREEELRRVATDLHDSVAQGLTSLQIQLSTIVAKTDADSPQRKQFEVATKRACELGKEVRQISHQLYPPALDLLGLNSALEEIFAPYRASGIECTLTGKDGTENMRLTQPAEVALYRIAQEAINNATRHGKAQKIDIEIGIESDEIQLTVTDNGIGFEVDKKAKGLGMTSMTSRITGVGGRLDVTSRPGKTCVKASVPLAKAKRQTPEPAMQCA